jgi:dihydroorotase
LIDRPEILEEIFANGDRLIAVHAEDQAQISDRRRISTPISWSENSST